MHLRGTRVLVMGLGVHGGGLGVTRWLIRQGAHVTVTDMATAEALAESLAALRHAAHVAGAQVEYVLGGHRAEDFSQHAMIVVNPAVRPDSHWLALARASGAQIETEMTLFFRHCPGPIIGITGTKGKSTTTLLTGAMLRQQYPDTVVAGNLRVSALEALEHITPTTPVVLELSSFQLMGLGAAGMSPRYACVTNIAPDHLDYHGSMQAYITAKQQIFYHQSAGDVVVLAEELTRENWVSGSVPFYRPGADALNTRARRCYTFSADPERTADCSITRHGQIVCGTVHIADQTDIRLPGTHNLANVLAATTLAHSAGVSAANIRAAIRSFGGVEHRLELVAEHAGIRYINDTTATNPTAAQAALHSFSEPIVLLAGGADKQLPLDTLAQTIAQRVKALVLLAGSATERLEHAVRRQSRSVPISGPYTDFAAAIHAAQALAAPGDVILLSPGCASFGMFLNEFHRGEEFRRIVTSEKGATIGL